MPDEMMNNMKQFKENNYVYPFNIFIPSSFGKISTVLGFQIFLLLLFFYKSENFKIIKWQKTLPYKFNLFIHEWCNGMESYRQSTTDYERI